MVLVCLFFFGHMIIELIILCVCMAIIFALVIPVTMDVIPLRNTSSAIILQELKYDSIAKQKTTDFVVKFGQINQIFDTNFDECHLQWTPSYFRSGTCKSKSARLTIMAIVGEIGYPW